MHAVASFSLKKEIFHHILIDRSAPRSQRIGGIALQGIQNEGRYLLQAFQRILLHQSRQSGKKLRRNAGIGGLRLFRIGVLHLPIPFHLHGKAFRHPALTDVHILLLIIAKNISVFRGGRGKHPCPSLAVVRRIGIVIASACMRDPEISGKRHVLHVHPLIHRIVHAVIHAADHVGPFSPVKPLRHLLKQCLVIGAVPVSTHILAAFKSFQIQHFCGLSVRLQDELHRSCPIIVSPADPPVRACLLRQSSHIPKGPRHISFHAIHQLIKNLLIQQNRNRSRKNHRSEEPCSGRTALYRKLRPSNTEKRMASLPFTGIADHLKSDLKQQNQCIADEPHSAYTRRRCRVLLPDRKHRQHQQRKRGKKQADSMLLHHTFQQKKNDGQNCGKQKRCLRDIRRLSTRSRRQPVQQSANLQPKRIPQQTGI